MSTVKTKQRYQDPKRYIFDDEDLREPGAWFWRCPVRLIDDGVWARLWRAEGTTGGGGTATSVLPVLALHSFLGTKGSSPGWTEWKFLTHRKIAALAGVNKASVKPAMDQLAAEGLLQYELRPRPEQYAGGKLGYFRLSAALYPAGGEPYTELDSRLFFGGIWAMLPRPAYRHLYVVLAALDPIRDEDAYLSKIESEAGEDSWVNLLPEDDLDDLPEDEEEWSEAAKRMILAKRRSSEPKSLTELVNASGLSRATVIDALQGLSEPIFGDVETPTALIQKGERTDGTPTWYAPDRRVIANEWYWEPFVLNDVNQVKAKQQVYWPHLFKRRAAQKKRK